MGANFSSGNNLYIHVDRPYYSPGEAVNGQALLNCVAPFQSTALVLKIEGYEQASWSEHRSDSYSTSDGRGGFNTQTREVIDYHSGKRELFKIRVPLQAYPHQVQPGQYQYPFYFVLPMNLPGSLEFSGSSGTSRGRRCTSVSGKIRYKVEAECEVPGMLTSNLRFKHIITMHERMARPPSQIVMQDLQSVTACCCCNKGNAQITAHVEKDSYFPGEMACAIVEIDNQSSVAFSAIALELHCRTFLQSNSGCVCESNNKLQTCSVPGVKAGEQQLGEGARRISIQLPTQLLSSSTGLIVQCRYTLDVRLKAPMHVSDPCVSLPITIFQAIAPSYVAYSAPPAYWQPQAVGNMVNVPMPSAPPMPPPGQVMGMPADVGQLPYQYPGMQQQQQSYPGGMQLAPQPVPAKAWYPDTNQQAQYPGTSQQGQYSGTNQQGQYASQQGQQLDTNQQGQYPDMTQPLQTWPSSSDPKKT